MTKRSTANANTEESIPPAMSQRSQHLSHAMLRKPATTTPKQFQTTCCFGKDWQHAGGARDLQLQEVVLPSCVESFLPKQNPTLIYLRNVKSFVLRAGRKVPHCQKWDCHALPLFALDKTISRQFSISILIAGKTKNGRAESTGACGNPVLGVAA